jgi:hypothetical protein
MKNCIACSKKLRGKQEKYCSDKCANSDARKRYNKTKKGKEAGRKHHLKWIKNNPIKAKESQANTKLKIIYGITLDDKRKMYDSQYGRCAICMDEIPVMSKACVDHDHVTGEIRMLLCHRCNRCLGLLQDDITILDRAIRYLKSYKEK